MQLQEFVGAVILPSGCDGGPLSLSIPVVSWFDHQQMNRLSQGCQLKLGPSLPLVQNAFLAWGSCMLLSGLLR